MTLTEFTFAIIHTYTYIQEQQATACGSENGVQLLSPYPPPSELMK